MSGLRLSAKFAVFQVCASVLIRNNKNTLNLKATLTLGYKTRKSQIMLSRSVSIIVDLSFDIVTHV